ncbi:MAG: alpha-ribazole phosphatase [Terracidiphilus sp.]|nr:alpha-ribazole phosphatase [Terracidiphilus sp.]
MSASFLYLVRHGQVISVNGKAYIGQTEAPLSEAGVEQAWALRTWLKDVTFSHVYTSELSRAQRTARIIVGNRSSAIHVTPALNEISLGDWDGISFKDIEKRFPEEYAARGRDMANWRPPHGESFADCRTRVLPAIREIIQHGSDNVLVVGHAGVNRTILCEILGIQLQNLFSIGQDYGAVNILEITSSRVRLKLLNFLPPSVPAMEDQVAQTSHSHREKQRRRQTCPWHI